jgi:hypothetical protein
MDKAIREINKIARFNKSQQLSEDTKIFAN